MSIRRPGGPSFFPVIDLSASGGPLAYWLGGLMNNHLFKLFAATTFLLMGAGCDSLSETPPTFDADSYTYKGADDPLLSVSGAERAGPLGDRFDLVQGRE